MTRSVRWAASILGLQSESGAEITGWSVDSRTLRPGDLFFALRGPNHDGHVYAKEVLRKGAAAVVVDREMDADRERDAGGPVLRTDNTLDALQRLASKARAEWAGEVVAVTGSAGKTTTKDVIAELLNLELKTAKSEGNLNNHVGVPLSLLRIPDDARAAVIEMGMNHGGEIRDLARMAKPDMGVVTNVGAAHLEAFDSMDGVAAAKRELVEELPADGAAVLNADDARVKAMRNVHPGRVTLYGTSPDAEVRAEDVEVSESGVRFRVGSTDFASSLTGRHNVSNLLAGIAVAGLHGIAPGLLSEKIRNFSPAKMRGERFHYRDVLVYNDCYNSNPDAVRVMLDVLKETPARTRIAVLGEMLELGRWAEPLHREIGNYVAQSGIQVLVGIRGAACFMLDAAKRAGLRVDAAFFFEDPAEAGELVRKLAQPGDAILFKGSRGVHVERALERFLAPTGKGGEE